MKIAKILFLQAYWYICVAYGYQYEIPLFIAAIVFIISNYFIYKPKVTKGHYLFSLGFFVIYGIVQESLFEKLNLVDYNQETFPLWLTSLYVVFLGYYGDILDYLSEKPKFFHFLLGAIGGFSAYFGGAKLSPIEPLTNLYFVAVAIGWGIFFPLSIKIFYEGFMWNKILDASIYYSFDLSGYLRHKKEFDENIIFEAGTNALITGGTSGIGHSCAQTMAEQGVNVLITGRNNEKGQKAAQGHEKINFLQFDMIDWNQIQSVVNSISQPLDFLVLNAGGMPDGRIYNEQGVESQFASQLIGHFLLAKKLKEDGKLKSNAKIVWVTSGGMYLRPLDLNDVFEKDIEPSSKYDKVGTYANVKRAQVTLLPYFKNIFNEQVVTAMHPGWAATPGVDSAIPGFAEKMEGRLRSPAQGADTILWLLSTKKDIESGGLYFDRKKVKTHLFWFTKKSEKLKEKLITIVEGF